MLLEEIVDASVLEDSEQECKGRLDRKNTIGWLKTVAGFANAHGGTLYIGVEDKSNNLIGYDRREADNERNYFNNIVNEHIFPRPVINIKFVKYVIRENERYILCINIAESQVKPVILKMNEVPGIFIRREGYTGSATYEEIRKMAIETSPVQFDLQNSSEVWEKSSFNKLFAFSNDHSGKKFTEKALRSMDFFNSEGILKNGAVLFSDDYSGRKTAVQCSVFSGTTKGAERIVTVNRFKGCITDTIQFMLDFVQARMNHSIIKLSDSRINIDSYPGRALFEGIINAVAHRDYYLDGTQIQIDMFRDRLEISSPGSFYDSEPLGKTYDLSHLISRRRNELICNVLVACNVMEAAGTGFDKIVEDYRNADEKHRPYVYSASDHFTLILPDLTYENGIAGEDTVEVSFIPVPDGTKYDAKVLSYCYTVARKASEIATFLGLSNSSYLRHKVLENLVKNDYLMEDRIGRTCYYKTNKEIVNEK